MKFNKMPSGASGLLRRMMVGPGIAIIVLLAALGWQGIRMAPLLWPMGESTRASEQSRGDFNRATADKRGMQAHERLARLHLFGVYSPESERKKQASAPETKLDLTLKGVYAPYGDSGMAMIKLGNGDESVFTIGERIGGAAEVAQVLPGKVILRRNGHREALSMYDEGTRPND